MRRLVVFAIAAAAVSIPVVARGAPARAGKAATSHELSATLSPGAEPSAVKGMPSRASGTFTATLTVNGKTGRLAWRLAVAGLSGPVTAAGIHLAAPGKTAPTAIPLCSPCRRGAHGTFTGRIGGRKALLRALLHRGAYVNVQTKQNPSGEIRGRIGNWLSYAKAGHTATLTLIAGLDHGNSGLNFDGYAKGALAVSIPEGWKVTVDCSNRDATRHSCAIVKDARATGPVFPGAATRQAGTGLSRGEHGSFTFTARRTGDYRVASLAGHEQGGIWDRFRVTSKGTPAVAVDPATAVVVTTRKVPGLGRVLVDGQGLTLYMFVPDKQKKVTCTSACAAVWPPLKLPSGESALAQGGASAKLLGSDHDPAGGHVVTYHGWPLYTYVADKAPGDAGGQGLNLNGGLWYVLAPSGKVIHAKPSMSGGGGGGYGGSYG